MSKNIPKVVKTDSIFTKGGDEIKRRVTDNDVSMFVGSIAKQPVDEVDAHHKVLQAISDKKEQRAAQFVRAEIAKESKAPGHIVDQVIQQLLAESRIRKVGYNTYSWTLPVVDSKEREERIEPLVNFLSQYKSPNSETT